MRGVPTKLKGLGTLRCMILWLAYLQVLPLQTKINGYKQLLKTLVYEGLTPFFRTIAHA